MKLTRPQIALLKAAFGERLAYRSLSTFETMVVTTRLNSGFTPESCTTWVLAFRCWK